jgi:hypothetical protein
VPFLDNAIPSGLTPQKAEPLQIDVPTPPLGSVFQSAIERDATTGSAIVSAAEPRMSPPDPNFDPFKQIQGYEAYAAAFIDANSDEDVYRIKARLDKERRREETLDAAGPWGLVAGLAAGVVDPVNFIPVGGAAVRASRLGRAGAGALQVGAAGLVSGTAAEVLLQTTQLTRSAQESALNIAASTLLSGVLGGAVGGFSRGVTEETASEALKGARIYERELTGNLDPANDTGLLRSAAAAVPGDKPDPLPTAPVGGDSTVGAAAARATSLEDESFSSALGAEKALAFSSPTLRLGTSPSVEVRRMAQELAEQPLEYRKNQDGTRTLEAAETRIRLWQVPLAESLVSVDDAFVQYRLGRERKTGDIFTLGVKDILSRDTSTLTRNEFNEAVSMAMRRNDTSDIPEVAKAAKAFREKLFEPLKERAIATGLLPEDVDVKTAESYMMRVYDHMKIKARRGEFTQRITRWLADEQDKKRALQSKVNELLEERERLVPGLHDDKLDAIREGLEETVMAWEGKTSKDAKGALKRRGAKEQGRDKDKKRLKEADPAVEKAVQRIAKAKTNLEPLDLQDTSRQIIDRILGTPAGRLPYDVETPSPKGWGKEDSEVKRGPLAGRVFMIPDAMIEDFLENDISVIARMYTRTMAADVELAAKFGRADMQDQFQKITQHYEILRQGKDEKGEKGLGDKMKADIRDLAAIRDRIRGTYALPEDPNGLWERAWRVARDMNYLRLLGGMTISALPDTGKAVFTHGMTRVFGEGLVPLLKDFQRFKLAAHETKLGGTAWDMILDSRAMGLADILDDYGRHSKFERGLQAATSKFGIVTLMAPWNTAIKQFVGVVSQTRALKAIEALANGGPVKAAERTRLAQLSIGPDEIRRINDMFQKHGSKDNNIWWAETGKWEDREAADILHGALAKEVNASIVTPGQEKPLWMSKGIGRVVGQFRSFSMSSTQRTMLAGLQKRDMATLNGVALMTALGMVSYWMKAQLGGYEKTMPDPTTGPGLAKWISEGVDKSGLTGWMFDAHNTVEKFTRGAVGLSRLTGQPMMSRYASRNAVDTVLGPTAGFISDVAKATGALGSGEWVASDTRAMRRMFPFQNAITMRWMFDEAEEGINQALGIPERREVTRR